MVCRVAAHPRREALSLKDTVIVFARVPRLGLVKRRLARGVGDRAASRFYRATLAGLLRALRRDGRFRTVVAVVGRGRWPWGVPSFGQGPGGLGHRMARAFARFPHGRVALVGSDIPAVNADDLAAAFAALGRAPAAFGPALDGGYWLVAMGPRRPARPFTGVRWSTQHALADTRQNFAYHRTILLRTLRDVDTMEDLHAWRS